MPFFALIAELGTGFSVFGGKIRRQYAFSIKGVLLFFWGILLVSQALVFAPSGFPSCS